MQVSQYLGINNIPIERILHRSDKTRCDGSEVTINGITFEIDEMIFTIERRLNPEYYNSIH